MKQIVRVVLGGVLVFVLAGVSWAGIRIDNPKVRVSVKPGSYASGEIKVENTGQQEIPVKVYLEDWVYAQPDGGKDFFPKGTAALSASNWITFYPADFRLKPGAPEVVRFTVNVPQNTTGGHYAVMFFETEGGEIEQREEDGSTAFVKVLNRLGSLFYVEAEGTVRKTAQILNLNLSQRLNDFIVAADFINTGNTDITVSGTFDVLDDSGFVFIRGVFDDVYTLPGDKAPLHSESSSANLKAGEYDILITLDFLHGGSLVQEARFSVGPRGEISNIVLK